MNNYNSRSHRVYYTLDDDEALLIPNTPPPPYSKRATTLHAKPTFWSPRQPPQNDGWRTLKGTRFVKSISRQVAFSIDNNRHNATTAATTMATVPLDMNIPPPPDDHPVPSTTAIGTIAGARNRTGTVTSRDNEQGEREDGGEERRATRQIRRRRREFNNMLASPNIGFQSYNDNNNKCTIM